MRRSVDGALKWAGSGQARRRVWAGNGQTPQRVQAGNGQTRHRLVRRLRRDSQSRSGRFRLPSAPITWGCLQWLDAVRMKGGESRLDQGRGVSSAPGRTAPKPKVAAVERRKACASVCSENARFARRLRDGCRHICRVVRIYVDAPFGAPLPRIFRGLRTRQAPEPDKTRPMTLAFLHLSRSRGREKRDRSLFES
jgi:hypothetical protein